MIIAGLNPQHFRIVPVLDLKGGVAVHAVGGQRAHYQPVQSRLHAGADPLGIARAFLHELGLSTLYVADLDAIAGAPPALTLYEALSQLGLSLWLDAGIRKVEQVGPLVAAGASTIVVGSETVAGPTALAEIVAGVGAERILFSLDMDAGRPRLAAGADWGTPDPVALAERTFHEGVRRVLLLDLVRVGTGRGLGTLRLVQQIRAQIDVEVAVGGGIACTASIWEAERAGASAVLVGSALHSGAVATIEGAPSSAHPDGRTPASRSV